MITRRLFTHLALSTLTLSFAVGCSQPKASETATSTTATGEQFKVAMLLSGTKNDGTWSQAGYEGLKLVQAKFNAQTAVAEKVTKSNSAAIIRQYAQDGYTFIIGHDGLFIQPSETVAKEFPRTKFAVVNTYPGNNTNLGAVAVRSGESGYLTGLLAGMKTKTNKVAYIAGDKYPVLEEEAALFQRGAKVANPKVQVSVKYLGSWTDTARGEKVAQDLVANGVDILAFNADEAGLAAIKKVTQTDGVLVIGWIKDQHDLAPGRVITSVLQDIPQLIVNAATLVQQGRWEGKLYKFGLREKIYDFAPFRGQLTPAQEATFNEAREKVTTGEIDVAP